VAPIAFAAVTARLSSGSTAALGFLPFFSVICPFDAQLYGTRKKSAICAVAAA
jgi:hypothetical protein